MSADLDDSRSCGPQLLPAGEPNSEWGLEQLGVYAQLQHRQIVDGETHLTRSYWRLGHALVLAKRDFGHGQWERYLKDLAIDKTRASKARAIYRAFANEADAAGLAVEEAYARRRRKPPTQSKNPAVDAVDRRKDGQALRRSIRRIADRTGAAVHDAAFAEAEEAVVLIPAVRKAITELQELLRFLEQQAASQTTEGNDGTKRS